MSRIAKHRTYRRLGTTRATAQRRILIVDDDPQICKSLRQSIQLWLEGVEVLVAPSAERAIELMAREPVNLVIADQWLPGMSGIDFMGHLKTAHPTVPCILITGHPHMDLVQDALKTTNVATFIPKPLRLESVITAVAGLLHLHGSYSGYTRAISSGLRGLRDDLQGLQGLGAPGDLPEP